MGRKQIEYRDPATLTPYANNPRDNEASVPRVKASIQEFHFQNPILVDPDGVVIAGHTRLKAALELGLSEVPVVVVDDLTPEQVRAYRLADNKAGEASEWLDAMLAEELAMIEGIDMSEFGFDVPDVDVDDSFGMGMGDGSEDDVPDVDEVDPTVKRGQVWRLGDHVLMCGDSTTKEDVDRLMAGKRAEMCFTIPPYNAGCLDVDYSPKRMEERHGVKNPATERKYLGTEDRKSDDEYEHFLDKSLAIALDHCEEVFFNIAWLAGSKRAVIGMLDKFKDQQKDIVYWKKSNPAPQLAKGCISSAVEPIWAFGENGTRAFRRLKGHYLGVIEGPNAGGNEFSDIHKATFPLYLPLEMVQTFTDPGETVLDLFGGTGTTLIACEQTGRRCRMMELDPRYCDVIIARWEKATGRKAELMEAFRWNPCTSPWARCSEGSPGPSWPTSWRT